MYTIRIEDKSGEILKEYKQNEIYVTKIEINQNVIDLYRIEKNPETGNYTMIDNDQIMNNVIEMTGKNYLKEVVTKERETTLQVTLLHDTQYKMSKLLTPKEMLYEGDRILHLEREKEILASYYVYAKGKLIDVFSAPSDAVNEAALQAGTVVNDNGSYIWESGSRAARKQISGIDEELATEEISSYEICLKEMLHTKGVVVEVDALLRRQLTPMEILRENMPAKVLDLTGCPLNAVLYYINQGIPVMVPLGDGECVMIVGYDEKNVILYRPNEGTIKKMGNNDATNMFSEYGNKYITYINE
ncbi:MAG: hypothetical protein GX567_02290 [Clostridia bacterium]|nr:hypothetical protein [Clostridia bacterium]